MDYELCSLSIADAAKLIAKRQLSPVELTQAYVERIRKFDHQINAFITNTFERALQDARKAEKAVLAGNYSGALHGIPFAVKDVYDTAGILTTAGSRVCIDNIPAKSAAAVQRLQDAGTFV